MPFFPLAGGELVLMVLLLAIGRWVARAWWRDELEDETLRRWLPARPRWVSRWVSRWRSRREPRERWRWRPRGGAKSEPAAPQLRLIRGGRDDEPATPPGPRRASAPRDA